MLKLLWVFKFSCEIAQNEHSYIMKVSHTEWWGMLRAFGECRGMLGKAEKVLCLHMCKQN